MDLYLALTRNAFESLDELSSATELSIVESEKAGSGVRWIRGYVLAEENERLGAACLYEATSPEAIRTQAVGGLVVDEIIPVADTVIVRPDPIATDVPGP